MSIPPIPDNYGAWTILLLVYVTVVQCLRFRRCSQIQRRFSQRPLGSMTVKEAHGIMRQLRELEFPYALRSSTKMSTFQTGAFPTMANLFRATAQRSEKNNTKRGADTEVLMNEIHDRDAGSDAQTMAFARMNYMHSRYKKAGKILQEDMVQTLGLAVVEIFRTVEKYEWRQLTDVERCAIGVFHKAMGDAMEIPYDLLPSSKIGWKDGIHFAQELCDYAIAYQAAEAKPTESTRFISERLLELETANFPAVLKPAVEKVIATRLDENVRASMGLKKPGAVISSSVKALMDTRKFVLRYLSLPRPAFLAVRVLNDSPNPCTGRYTATQWLDNPWYIKPTFMSRWGPKAWSVRLFGTGNLPTKGGQFRDEGYDIRTIGPSAVENKGQAEVDTIFADLKQRNILTGCPFHA